MTDDNDESELRAARLGVEREDGRRYLTEAEVRRHNRERELWT